MKVNTTRFGVIDVDESSTITMAKGPLGFEDQTLYVLIQHRPDTKFRWLQSLEEPCLAFVVVDPTDFFADYSFEVPDAEAEKLRLASEDDALALLVVSIAGEGTDVTADLAAPIVINSKELIGMQVVLQDTQYSVKHPLVEQGRKQPAKAARKTRVTAKAA